MLCPQGKNGLKQPARNERELVLDKVGTSTLSQGTRLLADSLLDMSYHQDESGLEQTAIVGYNNHTDKNSGSKTTNQEDKPETEVAQFHLDLQKCRSFEEFQFLNKVKEGTYGVVYRGSDKKTGDIVALKHLKTSNGTTGFSIAVQREIDLLMKLEHINIITGHKVAVGPRSDEIFVVMEYVPHEVKNLMQTMRNNRLTFGPEHVKCIMIQLLTAVQYLHDSSVFHRDLKTSNILLTEDGILKVADFGLAREYEGPHKQYSPDVATLWYCAPEVLLDSKTYGTPLDMWSVGCIFGELITLQPLLPGTSQLNQLKIMYEVLGTPSDRGWPGYSALPLVSEIIFDEYPSGGLRKKINEDLLSESGFSLLVEMLTYDPSKRVTATEALLHPYFNEEPAAIEPAMFMSSLWLEDSGSDTEDHEQYCGSDTEDHGKYYGSDTWYDESYYSTDSEEDLTSDANSSVSSILNTDDDTTE
ncbi:hypothetical protein SFRURICE_011418 [Spodoptera frugiperda]|nr:hypothetical protein SFRURICE_011418 [Spodoptera frugiperda]